MERDKLQVDRLQKLSRWRPATIVIGMPISGLAALLRGSACQVRTTLHTFRFEHVSSVPVEESKVKLHRHVTGA